MLALIQDDLAWRFFFTKSFLPKTKKPTFSVLAKGRKWKEGKKIVPFGPTDPQVEVNERIKSAQDILKAGKNAARLNPIFEVVEKVLVQQKTRKETYTII